MSTFFGTNNRCLKRVRASGVVCFEWARTTHTHWHRQTRPTRRSYCLFAFVFLNFQMAATSRQTHTREIEISFDCDKNIYFFFSIILLLSPHSENVLRLVEQCRRNEAKTRECHLCLRHGTWIRINVRQLFKTQQQQQQNNNRHYGGAVWLHLCVIQIQIQF